MIGKASFALKNKKQKARMAIIKDGEYSDRRADTKIKEPFGLPLVIPQKFISSVWRLSSANIYLSCKDNR